MFERGKRPIDVAIELDLSANEVHDIQDEYWFLNDLHGLAFVYHEIKNYLPSFMRLFRMLKWSKMLGEDHISKFIKYADQDLPSLENKFQMLNGDIIDLQWKKSQLQDEVALLSSTISQQREALHGLQTAIELKKQILAGWDRKLNEKLVSIHSGNKQT